MASESSFFVGSVFVHMCECAGLGADVDPSFVKDLLRCYPARVGRIAGRWIQKLIRNEMDLRGHGRVGGLTQQLLHNVVQEPWRVIKNSYKSKMTK